MIIVKIKGGLGNQLFQYATARSLAMKLNRDLFLDLSFFEDKRYKGIFRLDKYHTKYQLADQKLIDDLKNKDTSNILLRIARKINLHSRYYKKTHWKEFQLESYIKNKSKISNSIYLDGWFANQRYFNDIRDTLLDEFNPRELSDKTIIYEKEIEKCRSIAIHIRRGDYLTNSYFKNLPINYYKSSIEYVGKNIDNPTFFFFSDDLIFVKEVFKDMPNAKFVDINNTKTGIYNTAGDVEDLYLMAKCQHQIIANSTYSWWGAWLNENSEKIVIAPTQWFNDLEAQKRYESGTLIPKLWVRI